MAIIPVGQKFHTLTSSTVTLDLGSARANSGREVYTMQDIIDTVPSGGATSLNGLTDCLVDLTSLYVGLVPPNLSGSPQRNTTLGIDAGLLLTTGGDNTFLGYQAGNTTTSAGKNVAIGSYALENSQTSEQNVAIGYESLESINNGDANTAVGYQAGFVNTGDYNTFLGCNIGSMPTSGTGVTVIGAGAFAGGSADSYATALGYRAGTRGSFTITIGTAKQFFGTDYGTLDTRIYGLRTAVNSATANQTLTANDSGETFVFSDADATLTLPNSNAGDMIGVYFYFVVLDDTAGTKIVQLNSTNNDKLLGAVLSVDTDSSDANSSFAAQIADGFNTITFDGTTTGRAGSKVTVTNIAADTWYVEGTLLCTGSPATPFS
jgi:hypothetical protein